MSWSDALRRSFGLALVAGLVLSLGACGFKPLYGRSAAGTSDTPALMARTLVVPIEHRIGQQLHNHLLDLMNPRGRSRSPLYELRVDLSVNQRNLAVKKSEVATRSNLLVTARFYLIYRDTGDSVYSGTSKIVSGYNTLDSDYETLMAEKDARGRAVKEISEDIFNKVAVYFNQLPKQRQSGK